MSPCSLAHGKAFVYRIFFLSRVFVVALGKDVFCHVPNILISAKFAAHSNLRFFDSATYPKSKINSLRPLRAARGLASGGAIKYSLQSRAIGE